MRFPTSHHPLRPILTVAAALLPLALAACGGGGGGSTTSSSTTASTTTVPSGTTLTTAQYASGSVEAAMFSAINADRQMCGFPVYQENTLLDQAAQNHTVYMLDNGGTITDYETQGNPGFTGVTGQDRAESVGWPSGVSTATGSGGYYTNATLTGTQYGDALVAGMAAGVYHQGLIVDPVSLVGFGESQTTYNGYPQVVGSVMLGQFSNIVTESQSPLTFPCQGATGLPYKNGGGETPTPPNTSGSWGTPVTVMGNPSDTIRLTSATITGPSGSVAVQILDSSTDPNHEIQSYEGVVYPTSALVANTQYSVTISGTVNGASFSRNFTFTTGSTIG